MLVVLTLLAVIAALVVPETAALHSRSNTDDVGRAASSITDLLRQARLMALERNTNVDVLIEPRSARVWVLVGAGPARNLGLTTTLPLTAGVDLVARRPRLRFAFDATGRATGDTLFVHGATETTRVTVDSWSGAPDASMR